MEQVTRYKENLPANQDTSYMLLHAPFVANNMWGKPHKPSTKDSEHMKVLLEVIVKITLQNISIYQTTPQSATQ